MKNRTIFTGDNLEVLRGVDSGSIDLIYADPPFNSNRNYAAPIGSEAAGAAFKDTWTLSDLDRAWLGEIGDRSPAVEQIVHGAGLAHSKGMQSYLTMMAVRLFELRRVLAPTGSIYLHVDPTASHYLKCLMDSIFGRDKFRNEITWKRTFGGRAARGFRRSADAILFYSGGEFTPQHVDLSPEAAKEYRNEDPELGPWRRSNIAAPTDGYRYDLGAGEKMPANGYRMPEATARAWMAEGRLVVRPGKVPYRKFYLSESKGTPVGSVWTDIHALQSADAEKLGYPTQKPVALLERVIKASSNPGDLVLDPFCGCATTCIAAERLDREWIGIDLSPKAVELVNQRMRDQLGLFGTLVKHRVDTPPRRTDTGPLPPYRTHKRTLYGHQEGDCAGCRIHFPFRNLTVDHVVPQAKGGSDHIENLQLLCGHCNSVKGTGTMAELKAKLAA